MKNIPLRFSIALSFICLVLTTSIVVAVLSYKSGQRDVSVLANRLHSQTFARVHGLIENFMSTPQRINEEILLNIYSGTLDTDNPTGIGKYLFRLFQQYPNLISMEYADENRNDLGPARNLFDTELSYGFGGKDTDYVYRLYEADHLMKLGKVLYEEKNYDPRTKSWYRQGLKADEATWTPIYIWPNGDVGLDAIVPVKNNGKVIGVLDTAITLNEIGNFLRGIQITPNSKIYLIEATGLLVTGTDIQAPYTRKNGEVLRISATDSGSFALEKALNHLSAENIGLSNITGEKQFTIADDRGFVTIAPYSDIYGLNWLVVMYTPEEDIMSYLYANSRNTSTIIVLATLLAVFVAYLLSSWITSPISKLTEYSKALARGDWNQTVAVNRGDEVGKLAEAFRQMSSQLQDKTKSLEEYAQRMLDQRQQLEAILSSMGDGVCVIDNHKKVILVNNAMLKISKYSQNELLGLSVPEFIHLLVANQAMRDKTKEILDLLFSESSGVMYFDLTEIKRKDGSPAVIDAVGSRLKDEKGRTAGIVLVMRDVTKQQELENMKNIFVSLASHQLRTPLTGIKWSIGSIKEAKATVPAKIMNQVKLIEQSNNKMISLVEALLSISRVESDRASEVRKTDSSVKSIITKAYAETRRTYSEKKIRISGINKINPAYQIRGDEQQLVQIFVNLLQNAAIYSHLEKTVKVEVKKTKDNYLISVSDKGFGIPKDQQSRIFERFFRASNVSEIIPGTGLGLYYVKKVVDLQGGKIWFKSELNKGTTFYVELPATVNG